MDSSTTLKSIEDLNLIAFTLESYTHQEEWSPLAITTCSGFPYSYSGSFKTFIKYPFF